MLHFNLILIYFPDPTTTKWRYFPSDRRHTEPFCQLIHFHLLLVIFFSIFLKHTPVRCHACFLPPLFFAGRFLSEHVVRPIITCALKSWGIDYLAGSFPARHVPYSSSTYVWFRLYIFHVSFHLFIWF